jgi:hypothetical protein
MRREQTLTLPDGREVDVTVRVTDEGAVHDDHGEWINDDGRAYVDIGGDFKLHVGAREVLDAATAPYYGVPTPEHAQDSDDRRLRFKIDQHLPLDPHDPRRQAQREDVFRRAQELADATREQRLADAHEDEARWAAYEAQRDPDASRRSLTGGPRVGCDPSWQPGASDGDSGDDGEVEAEVARDTGRGWSM